MRKRIEKLARGIFEYDRPALTFFDDKIEFEVLEGQDYTGEFTFSSANDLTMRGVVYTSCLRMECLTPQFEGKNVKIRYQFHGAGLMEGDVKKGDFYIIANQGEYNLSFVVDITGLYADSCVGKIRSLSDFTRLAKENYKEACRVFASRSFENILKKASCRERMLYRGLSQQPMYPQNVEEFLVAAQKKSSVVFSVERRYREYEKVTESLQDFVEIKKDQWGYVAVEVCSDSEFLVLEKKTFTSEDFVGSSFYLYYVIKEEKLHAGKNYARICLHNMHQSEVIDVCVRKDTKDETLQKDYLTLQRAKAELTALYVSYRLKRMVTGTWAIEMEKVLKRMQALAPESNWPALMRAQTLLMNRQRQEAIWILDEIKRAKKQMDGPQLGYYKYLCTLVEREPSYVRKMTEEIVRLDEEYDSDILFGILLFLKEEYLLDDNYKLARLYQKIEKGSSSPFFYLEAYYLYEKNPYLLTELGDTELKILWWAAKQKALTGDIIQIIMQLAPKKRKLDKRIYRLLAASYECCEKPELLTIICSYLIKGQCFSPDYLRWYTKAIEEELHITNLNEAYMLSLDARSIVNVPKVIQMYFQYGSHISYEQQAVLFVNIIANKEKQPQIYEGYRKNIESFAMDQLRKGRIDDNLSVIYEEVLDGGFLTEETAALLSRVLFVNKVSSFSADVVSVVLVEPYQKSRISIPLNGSSVYIPIFSKDYVLLLEDRAGRRYATLSCQVEKLMQTGKYFEKCIRYTPDKIEYALGLVGEKTNFCSFDSYEGELLSVLLASEKVSEAYKAGLCPKLLEYYCLTAKTQELWNYINTLEFSYLTREARKLVLELLMESQMYQRACELVREYGREQLKPERLIALCTYEIEAQEYGEDDFLVGLCMDTVLLGKYNDVLLRYLGMHYNGPTKRMYDVWRLAGEYELDVTELAEKILVQMLYTTEFVEGAEEVYKSFLKNGGSRQIALAYLNYFAQSYFVEDTVIDEAVFLAIRDRLEEHEALSDACKLALLKYYAMHKEQQKAEETCIDELLCEYTAREMYFSFYKRFDQKLLLKYFLYDKFFVEYHGREHAQVFLNYCTEDKADIFEREEMQHMYGGIYVKQLVLFFGDNVAYYIEEKVQNRLAITESNKISCQNVYGDGDKSSYLLLNEIGMQQALDDKPLLEKLMWQYEEKLDMTKAMFQKID